jgi:membrane protease YdiL (CAAX protease family)
MMESSWGYAAGLVGSNALFALAHAITRIYALLAGLVGIYLGLMLDVEGERNLLIPVLVHGIYDFLAFSAVAIIYRRQNSRFF